MNNDNVRDHIRQHVLERVRSGAVQVHSRGYFLLRAGAAAMLAVLALFISAYTLSFVVFSVQESGELFLLGFGLRGVATFFTLFPYVPLALDIGVIVALEWLVAGFRFGYRISLVSLFGVVFGASAIMGFLLYLTPLHVALLSAADRGELPLLGDAYEHIHDPHHEQGVFRGIITSIESDRIVIGHDDADFDSDDGTRTVLMSQADAERLAVGEHVFVFGTSTGEGIEPYGVQPFQADRM